jgi:hypothetical protein
MNESIPGEAAREQAAPRPAGASARLPWRYAEIGRRRLAGIAAGRAGRAKGRNGVDIDDHIRLAVREETAATLGRAGRRLQAAVLALADFDRVAGHSLPLSPARRPLLREAALALWECVVQREAIGLTNHDLLEQLYGVTPELWRLMGSADVAGA